MTIVKTDTLAGSSRPRKNGANAIAAEPQRSCVICGGLGEIEYRDLPDRLFGVAGLWNFRKCGAPDCGTLWMDPRPILQDIGKAYAYYFTHEHSRRNSWIRRILRFLAIEYAAARFGYDSSKLPWSGKYLVSGASVLYPGLREYLETAIRYLRAPPEQQRRLLDVGCGDGEALDILKSLGWDVVGVEVDKKAVQVALARGLDVRQGRLQDAELADECFDIVTSSHVIEHVHDPIGFLQEQRRLLKPNGRLVAVTPNADGPTHSRWAEHWLGLDPPRHLLIFTKRSLQKCAVAAGFSRMEIFTSARGVAQAEIASRKICDDGIWDTGSWPGLRVWLQAQATQWAVTRGVNTGRKEGEELVLVATK